MFRDGVETERINSLLITDRREHSTDKTFELSSCKKAFFTMSMIFRKLRAERYVKFGSVSAPGKRAGRKPPSNAVEAYLRSFLTTCLGLDIRPLPGIMSAIL